MKWCATEQGRRDSLVSCAVLLVATSLNAANALSLSSLTNQPDDRLPDDRVKITKRSDDRLKTANFDSNVQQHTEKHLEQHTIFQMMEQNEPTGLKDIVRLPSANENKGTRRKHKNRKHRKHRHRHSGSRKDKKTRSRTSNSHEKPKLGIRKQSCASKTSYVLKTDAEDIYGYMVEIHPVIKIGKLNMNQFFYESFCDNEGCNCTGMDRDRFETACETAYSYTHARVVKNGEVGWTYIKVRSGCNCVVREKRTVQPSNILDMLGLE